MANEIQTDKESSIKPKQRTKQLSSLTIIKVIFTFNDYNNLTQI